MKNDPGLWIKEGYKLFAENGLEGLKIMPLSRRVGIAKSSFYYFFDNTQIFFSDVIEHWVAEYTIRAFEICELEKSPRNKYCSLGYLSNKDSVADSFYTQLLLLQNKGDHVLERMEYARRLREEYVVSLLNEAGFDEDLIKEKLEILLSLNFGWSLRILEKPMSDIEKMQSLTDIWDSMLMFLDNPSIK